MLTLAMVLHERIDQLNWSMVKRSYLGCFHKGVVPETNLDAARKHLTGYVMGALLVAGLGARFARPLKRNRWAVASASVGRVSHHISLDCHTVNDPSFERRGGIDHRGERDDEKR